MALRLRDFLLHPDTFFKELAHSPDEYKTPLIIVGTCMVFDAIHQFLLTDWMRQALLVALPNIPGIPGVNELLTGTLNLLILVSVIHNIPAFIAYWLIIAAVFYILSGYFSSEGTLYKTVIATGWGMAPFIVYNAISVPLFLMYRNVMTLTISPEAFNQTISRHYNSTYSSAFSSSPDISQYIHFNQSYIEYSQISYILYAISLLCCCLFWIYAVKNIRSLTLKQSAVTVVGPVLLYLVGLLAIKIMNGWM